MRVLFILLALAGCAGPQHQPVWLKDGATQADFDKDKAFCEYEALKSVQGYDRSMRSMFGQELDLNMRRSEVARACMRVRGYRTK